MMYVIVERNQASRRPSIASTDIYDDRASAEEIAKQMTEIARNVGRHEEYTVHPLGEEDEE